MLTFETISDLQYLPPDDPAQVILREIIEKLNRLAAEEGRPYRANIDGNICLAEARDIGHTFTEVLPGYSYETAPWEAVHIHPKDGQTQFFVAAFVPNNTACTLVLFPNEDWLPNSLRRVLCANLVPNVT